MGLWKRLFGNQWVVRYQKDGQTLYIGQPSSVSDPRKAELGDEETQKDLAAFMQKWSVSQEKASYEEAINGAHDRSSMIANLAHNLDVFQRNRTLRRHLILRGYNVDKEVDSAPTAQAISLRDAITNYRANSGGAPAAPRTAAAPSASPAQATKAQSESQAASLVDDRKRIILQGGRSFYCLIPTNEDTPTAQRCFDECVAWFQAKNGNVTSDVFIELALLTSNVPAIALSGVWPDGDGAGLPKNVLMQCDVFVDNKSSTVRKNEYLQRFVSALETKHVP